MGTVHYVVPSGNKDPKIISQIKPFRETKPKAEAWQDPTYSEKIKKQPFKGQKGRLKAMFLTFEKNFWEKFGKLIQNV